MKRPKGIDKAVIDNIEMLGSDLEKEHEVEFFLYFPDEHAAYAVAAALSNFQFKASVSYSEFSEDWLCFATKSIIVSTGRLVDIGNWMEDLAENHGGNYDGWGVGIEPEEN